MIAAVLAVAGVVQWKRQSGRQQKEKYILDYAGQVSELESQRREEERQLKQEEEKKQRDRVFGMDFLITHGSAFGGCAAVCADGTIRKDKVALDNILMSVSYTHLKLQLGELAVLEVAQVNNIGGFMYWGLEKDLLLPYSEQIVKVQKGDKY